MPDRELERLARIRMAVTGETLARALSVLAGEPTDADEADPPEADAEPAPDAAPTAPPSLRAVAPDERAW